MHTPCIVGGGQGGKIQNMKNMDFVSTWTRLHVDHPPLLSNWWRRFDRTEVSISTKKQEIEDVIEDLEVPNDGLFFCENGHLGAIETEPWA